MKFIIHWEIKKKTNVYFPAFRLNMEKCGVRTEWRKVRRISLYSVRIWENTDQKNSEYEHFPPNKWPNHPVTITKFSNWSSLWTRFFWVFFGQKTVIILGIKDALLVLWQFLAFESPLKMMKNAFYFTSKVFLFSRYLSFC